MTYSALLDDVPRPAPRPIARNIESGLYDDQPNTPSKSKMMPRRPVVVYLTTLTILLLVGMLFVRPEAGVGGERLSRGHGGSNKDPHRPRVIANSEARQREALEIADRLQGATRHLDPLMGQMSSGGSVIGNTEKTGAVGDPSSFMDGIVQNEPIVVRRSDVLAGDSPGSSPSVSDSTLETIKEDPSATQALAAAVERPETIVVSLPLTRGGMRDIRVEKSRWTFLETLSKGLESEDVEGTFKPEEKWWESDHSLTLSSWEVRRAITRDVPTPLVASPDEQTDDGECRIHVLDVNKVVGPTVGARTCNLNYKRVWPFSRNNWGIDGVGHLDPEHYQYASEYWLAKAIRESSLHEPDADKADIIFVDMYCYHLAWLAYIHPLGNRNTTDPEPYMRKTLDKIVKSERYSSSKGGDFVFVHPSPIMKGLFKEEAMCEDLASAFHLVPERSSLCVWTPDAASSGSSLIMPYVATLDLDFELDLLHADRDLLLYYRGGCGHPDPSVRGLFAAGKMLRYDFVHSVETDRKSADIDIKCSCDICDNHTPHAEVMQSYRRTRFCPILASNVQSSRRISEAILSGCIPVFIGPPFHSLPLHLDVDYSSMAIFMNVTNSSAWIDETSPHHLKNKLVTHIWPLDDVKLEDQLVPVDNMEHVVDYLRNLPPEVEVAKRRSVLQQRFKFYYGPVPTSAGGNGVTSQLGQIAMRHMCRHAAEERRKRGLSESQGIASKAKRGGGDKSSLMKEKAEEVWSFLKTSAGGM